MHEQRGKINNRCKKNVWNGPAFPYLYTSPSSAPPAVLVLVVVVAGLVPISIGSTSTSTKKTGLVALSATLLVILLLEVLLLPILALALLPRRAVADQLLEKGQPTVPGSPTWRMFSTAYPEIKWFFSNAFLRGKQVWVHPQPLHTPSYPFVHPPKKSCSSLWGGENYLKPSTSMILGFQLFPFPEGTGMSMVLGNWIITPI